MQMELTIVSVLMTTLLKKIILQLSCNLMRYNAGRLLDRASLFAEHAESWISSYKTNRQSWKNFKPKLNTLRQSQRVQKDSLGHAMQRKTTNLCMWNSFKIITVHNIAFFRE